MVPDKTLQHDVLAQLEFEPSINAAHIGVAAKDGVVTLTGHVFSFEQKLAAERAARSVRGVKAVAQEIEVRLPANKWTTASGPCTASSTHTSKKAKPSVRSANFPASPA